MKQITYLVIVEEDKRQSILNSKMALIRDQNMGWFEVPQIFIEEFKKNFGITGFECGVCRENITKEEINYFNQIRWHEGSNM